MPKARRAYSAVVELLPKDAAAHRALASVLKQAGDLRGAYDRLTAASANRTKDRRLAFELADVAARLGQTSEARARFEAIIADPETANAVRYPAKQRLAQLYQQLRHEAERAGTPEVAAGLAQAIEELGLSGGTENDIKVYLTWDTDHSDVDLWVTNPAGEKVFYSHRNGKFGEALFDDVTTGYGPESFTAPRAARASTSSRSTTSAAAAATSARRAARSWSCSTRASRPRPSTCCRTSCSTRSRP